MLFKMSAFSRGCLRYQYAFKSTRIQSFLCKTLNTPPPPPRFFTTSPLLRAARKTRAAPQPSKPSLASTKTSPPTNLPVYASYANTLANKSHPTLLYEAPSHTLLMICAWTGAATCFGYSLYNCWTVVLNPNPGLAQWIPLAFGGVVILMSALGTWLVFGTTGIVRSVTALPKKANQLSGVANRNLPKTSMVPAATQPELQIEIVLKKMLPIPFFPARVLYVTPSQIELPSRLAPPPPANFSPAELRQMRVADEARLKQEQEYERSHIMSSPFRHMSRALFALFKAIGRSWTGEGFMKIVVKGQRYKLDINGGWALDGGKALDRLATTKRFL
ncbi:uncharacterized protein LY89DRAFT_778775 [Mollisia scopiformis]|uniref:Uncharacterized protein n=1 Tax=Mollisia scopiformis TaxID=149040 RepID=A0A194XLZ7_MOLSC|nr:uncharacterized protein LY89DRAFT_778775 [Mollisia scopiformis]KUJ21161.1 hypothetical protein LY89DRAFT_778775 [Mollisia scopiformis]